MQPRLHHQRDGRGNADDCRQYETDIVSSHYFVSSACISTACRLITSRVLRSVSNTPFKPWRSCGGSPSKSSPRCHLWFNKSRARPAPFHAQKLEPAAAPPALALSRITSNTVL